MNELQSDLDQTATFFTPLENQPIRLLINSETYERDICLKDLGLIRKSEIYNQLRLFEFTQEPEKSRSPKKRQYYGRKISLIPIQAESINEIDHRLIRIRSGEKFKQDSLRQIDYDSNREITSKTDECRKIMLDQQLKTINVRKVTRCNTQKSDYQPNSQLVSLQSAITPRKSPSVVFMRNRLPDIFQTSQWQNDTPRMKKITCQSQIALISRSPEDHHIKGLERQRHNFMKPFNNIEEFRSQSPQAFQNLENHFQLKLSCLNVSNKVKPFLQRQPQSKIVDRIFSAKRLL